MNSTNGTLSIPTVCSALDIKKTVIGLIESGKVEQALEFFENHDDDAKKAWKEYDPKSHVIMDRPDKIRKGKTDYKTNRLPRNWQQYINEIELYFLMNNGIKWELLNDTDEQEQLKDAFFKFQKLLKDLHYNTYTRESKRLAGAETACAKLYAYYKDEGVAKLRLQVLSLSKGYKLRPLFNRYGDMKAFAVGFFDKTVEGITRECWDIYTSEHEYHCYRPIGEVSDSGAWTIERYDNHFGKIPIIYIRQPKAWAGVEERIERDEWLDSKAADTNEVFADPIIKISKNIKKGLADPRSTGKVVQVTNKDDVFEYLTPPESSDMKESEKKILKESILMGTLTPDFSYENVKGLGAISGEAITKANLIGYVKRLSRMEIYDEYFAREASLIKAIMATCLYPESRNEIRAMELNHIYQDPAIGIGDNSEEIQRWAEIGMSDEAIVEANRNVNNKSLELARLREKRESQESIQQPTQQED